MRNNIASFKKTSSSKVIFWAKFNAKIYSAFIFSIILTLLPLVFSKDAIYILIYLLADKANYDLKIYPKCDCQSDHDLITNQNLIRK